jgi:hypothetical protein
MVWAILAGSAALAAERAVEPRPLTSADIDALLAREIPGLSGQPVSDERFLRRASLDLIGRLPTPAELADFTQDPAADKRARLIDRLLQSKEFGKNWANYWISFRVPPPELTFLDYQPLKNWLADRLNGNARWDEISHELLTASGKVRDNPPATYVGYHQGNAARLSAETARIFLGLQLQCAECHDHKFDHWKRQQFHSFAAFFARTGVSMPWNDGPATLVKDKGKGEYSMPKGGVMVPAVLTGEPFAKDKSDSERRQVLADWVTQPGNPWFARAYVNRIWARLMGRGFFDPVDNMADYQTHLLPHTHAALAGHFVHTRFDIKDLFRLLMNTRAYHYERAVMAHLEPRPAVAFKLRGDQVFESLAVALALPNLTPPPVKATGAMRFPPPPKSTCDLINDRFNFDPSCAPEDVSRNLGQAMMLMNHEQIHKQINADPASGTLLSQILAQETDDRAAVVRLFRQILARTPTDREIAIALEHVQTVGKRGEAFEDLAWSLVNSAEFTTRR